jgi:hypothetical protein
LRKGEGKKWWEWVEKRVMMENIIETYRVDRLSAVNASVGLRNIASVHKASDALAVLMSCQHV